MKGVNTRIEFEVERLKNPSLDYIDINSRIGNEFVGELQLHIIENDDNYKIESFLASYKQKTGVPRALISRAVYELENLAKEKTVVHEPVFDETDRKKLAHIFEDYGYELESDDNEEVVYRRVYKPENKLTQV